MVVKLMNNEGSTSEAACSHYQPNPNKNRGSEAPCCPCQNQLLPPQTPTLNFDLRVSNASPPPSLTSTLEDAWSSSPSSRGLRENSARVVTRVMMVNTTNSTPLQPSGCKSWSSHQQQFNTAKQCLVNNVQFSSCTYDQRCVFNV